MAELRCKTCDGPLVERESRDMKKFLACPKSYKGNNHGTYSEGEYFYVEDRAEEGEGKYYWLPPTPKPSTPKPSTPKPSTPSTPWQARDSWRGMSSVWEDHVRQFSEECDYGLASISATEYDLGMSYWEGHY